jgi:carbamoyl-phosphate synthase small subunit
MYLVLENGKFFKGESFGQKREALAEIVFTTGTTGYLETLTDKSYFGQTVIQTFPLIGNYGVITPDFESETVAVSGYIVKEWCRTPSNFRSEGDLDAFLKSRDIPGICGLDTRALTKIIRENGVMNGKISFTPDCDLQEIKNYKILNSIQNVSVKTSYELKSQNSKYKIAVLDFGLKRGILNELLKRGADVTVFPAETPPELLKSFDGVMLTNGPGDPAENISIINNLKKLTAYKIPIFGICLGHQLLALARGFKTSKLKYGHRGANQPVKNPLTGRVYITTQNHGYAVISESVDKTVAEELFLNVNDRTNEGLLYKDYPAFSAQFHPEACAGPRDAAFLFDEFIDLVNGGDLNAVG